MDVESFWRPQFLSASFEDFISEHPCYECREPWYCWIHCRHGALFDCSKKLPSYLDQRLMWVATDDGMPERV